ncbi:MAG: rod shape-determining protein RodA [Candidatus Portnoybacteria bacterium CG_4_8_14_3_um_filter_40_10]|uniref:Rod shape-determining protein RodA n=3 Tax=Candidatus Portnoyibacteriota TaxID=1817913 RepID=A0A2M7IHJ3_9BACT|nr:MAG: rod shape-determining protein RodA [Candidatus Portnoybacteria bacterium CG11_big_fil_rev_8_21_14_0_20_40_15]PIS31728.1 MAG: rod shape-determining protein RodA [Candidatus Portnoybacteria bacterium CG08_land_8_20_14_0_20_40_83]PIW76000.1 MAG: rod shape-determining protein RodA [Candidatus Portnoybacteria bacterium CG_4_8_14_3_um_filter_40_10]PIY74657.1 MAG: rod shape-determining protein RodA [Candidatus Portnoybacteria bacterium CG_4_10_14_0_8_um_filter_40_50]
MNFASQLKKFDWILIGAVLVLCALSLLTLYSINYGKPGFIFFQKQVFFVILGLAAMATISFLDTRIFKNYPSFLIAIYLLVIALLVSTLIFGKITRGTLSWLKVGEIGFEPVELAKLVIILILAKYFSLRHVEMFRIRHIIASGVYVLLPASLILFQPDLGSAIILGAIWIGLVILAGIKIRHLVLVLLVAGLVFGFAWTSALRPYQKDRILTFLNPQRDPFGTSYNLIQSKIAIGEGGIFGRGLGQGIQGRLDFLPEKHSDFIFAAYAEEWGFVGVLFLLGVYSVIFFRLIKISLKSTNNFSRIFSAGVCLMIFAEVFINISVALGLLPITGISLPFVSYGGSGLLTHFLALGIVQSLVAKRA